MIDPTTRAYTIKLTGDGDWRQQLWSTHLAVNRGAWAWGEWLLTLRGGLPASLADGHPERRVLLALSWLSVENPRTLVRAETIASAGDDDRDEKVMAAFRAVLALHGVSDVEGWETACQPALMARIRDDAVWVNRAAAFQDLQVAHPHLSTEWAVQTLFSLLGGEDDYFSMPDDEEASPAEAKDFVQKAGGWLSRNWGSGEKSDASSISSKLRQLSDVYDNRVVGKSGSQAIQSLLDVAGAKSDEDELAENGFKRLKKLIGWKGRSSKGAIALEKLSKASAVSSELWKQTKTKLREEAGSQAGKLDHGGAKPDWMDDWRRSMESARGIGVPFRAGRDLIWEHGVMLDHALRRVSSAHSWIKRAEVSRREFQEAASKTLSAAAKAWLDDFCISRAEETGSLGEYVIQKRALDGWDKVVRAWDDLPEKAAERDRIQAARDVQSNLDDNDKLGDMTLFERLASEEAKCVWKDETGKADSQILKDYSAKTVAENNQRRFKVPAYRHPDPLRNPIYVDFGNSRWGISYSALAEAQNRPKLRQKLAAAKSDATRTKVRAELEQKPNLNSVTLGLWTGEAVENVKLRWQGKRLWKDLDLDHFDATADATVVRADRLGRAAQKAATGAVAIAEVFGAKDWNGRLQVPRKELDRVADIVYGTERVEHDGRAVTVRHGADYVNLGRLLKNPRANNQFRRLSWFLTTSAKLQPSGPWLDFVEKGLPTGIEYKKGRAGQFLNYEANKDRKGRARIILGGIPGLRILSFDLGVRYAAACAVWETLTQQTMKQEIKGRNVLAGSVDAKSLFLHTEHIGPDGKSRRTVYRRTAPDMWARLDRQFVIKLQGEDRSARPAHTEELAGFESMQRFLGLSPSSEKLRIDELQKEAVKLARIGLRRLGGAARIAYAMTATNKPISGGRTSAEFTQEERVAYLREALVGWQQIAHDAEYDDAWANGQWQSWIIGTLGGPQSVANELPPARSNRKQKLDAAAAPLKPVAEQLADPQSPVAIALNQAWTERYHELEQQWRAQLRWLRRLILPRNSDCRAGVNRIRNVGGLSVQRLQSIRGLYDVLRAFRMRPEPDNLRRNIPQLGDESLAHFGRRILDRLERLREQRIKQLASRIVEGALGAGRMKKTSGRDRKRPKTLVDEPCHVVVAENLERYLPEETRLRWENRRLMDWAARNVRKYIVEGCQLNGLHFVEVSPSYTSQQDSRTGAPGVRCEDVSVEVLRAAVDGDSARPPTSRLRRQTGWLASEIKKLQETQKNDYSHRQRVLQAAIECLPTLPATRHLIRLPRRGGELFVSANLNSPAAKGLQADLNAAANIGLKAILHPDFEGAWWFVLVNLATGKPEPDKIKGCQIREFEEVAPPLFDPVLPSGKPTKGKKREKTAVYAWNPLHGGTDRWLATGEFKAEIEQRVAQILINQQFPVETPW